MFDKTDFSGWKGRMSLFLESIDNDMPDILVDGPFVPTKTVVTPRPGDELGPPDVRTVVLDKVDWVDNDKRMVNLDVKARNFIVMAVPKDIYKAIRHCSTAKKMWETLTVMFEGCATSMESTKTTLTRRYERFFALKNESLTDTHTRFNALVNDLVAVGIDKSQDVLKSKFLDSLPLKWNNYVATVKLSPIYRELDLPGLYGLLHNHECTEAEKLIAMGETTGQSSSAFIASNVEHPNAYSNEVLPDPEVENELIERECEADSSDSSEGERIANEVAMLADRLRRKSFSKFKGKGKVSKDVSKKPLDMSKVTCYKCGKIGHMANDCRSKAAAQADSSKAPAKSKDDKYSKLKTKYKKLKAQVAKISEKSLVAKDWAESSSSSDDEVFEDARCMMAKADKDWAEDSSSSSDDELPTKAMMAREAKKKFLNDMASLREANEASTSTEVSPFLSLNDDEKLTKLNRLGDEVYFKNILIISTRLKS